MTPRLLLGAWLVAVWVFLWEDPTPANLLSGLLLAVLLVALHPPRPTSFPGAFRPWPVVRLVGFFLKELVVATALVAWEVVTPRSHVREGIVAVPVSGTSSALVTLVANMITLTPGTITIEVREDPTVLYVHVLHLRDIEEVRLSVLRIELHVLRAFGSREAIAAAEAACEACTARIRTTVRR